ncbi:MAG: hypothetical protein WCG05_03775 [Alphaproteobacteria bacterium]
MKTANRAKLIHLLASAGMREALTATLKILLQEKDPESVVAVIADLEEIKKEYRVEVLGVLKKIESSNQLAVLNNLKRAVSFLEEIPARALLGQISKTPSTALADIDAAIKANKRLSGAEMKELFSNLLRWDWVGKITDAVHELPSVIKPFYDVYWTLPEDQRDSFSMKDVQTFLQQVLQDAGYKQAGLGFFKMVREFAALPEEEKTSFVKLGLDFISGLDHNPRATAAFVAFLELPIAEKSQALELSVQLSKGIQEENKRNGVDSVFILKTLCDISSYEDGQDFEALVKGEAGVETDPEKRRALFLKSALETADTQTRLLSALPYIHHNQDDMTILMRGMKKKDAHKIIEAFRSIQGTEPKVITDFLRYINPTDRLETLQSLGKFSSEERTLVIDLASTRDLSRRIGFSVLGRPLLALEKFFPKRTPAAKAEIVAELVKMIPVAPQKRKDFLEALRNCYQDDCSGNFKLLIKWLSPEHEALVTPVLKSVHGHDYSTILQMIDVLPETEQRQLLENINYLRDSMSNPKTILAANMLDYLRRSRIDVNFFMEFYKRITGELDTEFHPRIWALGDRLGFHRKKTQKKILDLLSGQKPLFIIDILNLLGENVSDQEIREFLIKFSPHLERNLERENQAIQLLNQPHKAREFLKAFEKAV